MIVGSALLHAALLALLLGARAATPTGPDIGAMSVSLYDGAAPSPATTAPATPQNPPPAQKATTPKEVEIEHPTPSDVEPQFIEVSLMQPHPDDRPAVDDPVALSIAAASAAAGSACDLTQWLQKALQADPQVQAALPLIPRPARSVANAIMLWNDDWIEPQAQASAGLTTLRLALMAGIRAAPAACREQVIHGPELITLSDGLDTTVLAIGSGEWLWSRLVEPAAS